MPIKYPEGPPPAGEDLPEELRLKPGEGINLAAFSQEETLDFGGPVGKCTGVYYGISFQLPKWGFQVFKVDEGIFVSPVFRDYYNLTIAQKGDLEARIKEGLRSISTAISDLELVTHDLRKYKEFMDYFKEIEEGKREKKPEKIKKGDQTLKSIFIDQVDVHTGEMIALKLIAPRWPTIIADFMQLTDEDIEPKKIKEKLKVSEAEGVVLATKNKLYQEWRDKLFRPTVEERYRTLFGSVEARKTSVREYKENLKPTIVRFKLITDALSKPLGPGDARKSFFRPDAQAYSIDSMTLWAWKPIVPSEKYKVTRELPLDEIHASKAGFRKNEIFLLHKEFDKPEGKWDEMVAALPQEPSIDKVVRRIISRIEGGHSVKISASDIFNARKILVDQFKVSYKGTKEGQVWFFSPYYALIEIPLIRVVMRMPGGAEIEGLSVKNLKGMTQTQNIIIARCIELIARDREMHNYVNQLLGEYGMAGKRVEELVKAEYPEIYLKEEEQKKWEQEKKKLEKWKKVPITIKDVIKKIRVGIGKIFKTLGWELVFLRAEGPYEFAFYDRISKFYLAETGAYFRAVKDFLKAQFGVPGVKLKYI